jgi:hypothetical protein
MRKTRTPIAQSLALLGLLVSPCAANDPATLFIPVADDLPGTDVRTSFVFDNTRNTLLIARPHGGVDRFSMTSQSFLSPWIVGTRLRSIDITPDGSRVLLAESTCLAGTGNTRIGRVHSIDAETGAATQITWETSYGSGGGVGAYDIAITNNGKAFFTPDWVGVSGSEFLREIDLITNTVRVRTDVPFGNGRTEIGGGVAVGLGRDRMMLWQGSSASAAVYTAGTDAFSPQTGPYVYGHISPDGQRIAAWYAPGSGQAGGRVVGPTFNQLVSLPGTALTYTFDPSRPLIYYADRGTGNFVTVLATTGAILASFHPGESFDSALALTVSADSRWAFIQVPNGIRAISIEVVPCYANCDGSTAPPLLNVVDFQCFLNRFSSGDSRANCDGSTNPPVLNVNDFACFLNKYSAGCPYP